ncbi:MAG TPA: hypothetical protein VM223_16035 [Planctomycetota bacterium]|nr:hypothetical protein [Planctomycetota bacterium]
MGDSLKKVQPGQPIRIPAAAYNAFIDAALDYRQRQRSAGNTPQPSFRQASIVLVQNDSGADVGRFAVLGINGPLITPAASLDGFKNHLALIGVTPDTDTHAGRFVITGEPIKSGEIGAAYAAGVCQVQIDVTDDVHEYADVADGDTAKLASGTSGACILWKDAGAGTKWAIVRLGNSAGEAEAGPTAIRRASAQEAAPSDQYLSVKLLDADGNETGDAFDVSEIGGRIWTSLNPNVIVGTRLLVTEVDGHWYALGFTPSQSSAGNVQRVTITGSGDGGYTWIEAQLGDGTPITLWNVNGNPWRDLLPNLKNTANRNKCFALNVGGTWYAIPDFSNVGRVT